MAVKELEILTEEERDLVFRAPALVSVLIAGAEGKIHRQEIIHAIKTVHYRALLEGDFLHRYYEALNGRFEGECTHLIQKFEDDYKGRETYIVESLQGLDTVLPKIERRYASDLLKSWQSLAKGVAKAAGGFLGFERISLEESHFVDLKMINYRP